MRVTFLLPPICLTGGIKVVALYAKHLLAQGHTVNIIAPAEPLPGRRVQLRNILLHGRRAGARRPPSHLDKLNIPYRELETARPIHDNDLPDADIVVATWWETAEWMMNLAPSKGRKVHFMQGYEVFSEQTAQRVHAVHRLPIDRIVISRWLQHMLRERDGVEAKFLVENGIDDQYFESVAPRVKPSRPTVGLLLSQGVKVKGMHTALSVIRNIQQRVPDLQVLSFAGHHVEHALDLPEGVRPEIDPPQERIREIYRNCSVWLSCSTNEGFNLTVVEALATGTPVVATCVGWPADGVLNGENGFVCQVDDVDEITRRVCDVLNSQPDFWQACSESARRSVRDLRLNKAAEAFESALLKMAAASGR